MRFASLGSGSKGNGTLVASGDTCLLVDCGFPLKESISRLSRLGLTPEDLDGILVTHEHSDHSSGVSALSRRYSIPVFLSHGTAASGLFESAHQLFCFNAGDDFRVGDIRALGLPVPHDAREPVQYRFDCDGLALGILTDLGSITPFLVNAYGGCTGLLLEFNHEPELLRRSAYPAPLKRRVGGNYGHLNNQQAARFLQQVDTDSLRILVAGHLSQQNNTVEFAREALSEVSLLNSVEVVMACQSEGFDWISLSALDPVAEELASA